MVRIPAVSFQKPRRRKQKRRTLLTKSGALQAVKPKTCLWYFCDQTRKRRSFHCGVFRFCLLLPKKMQKSVGLHPKPIEAQRGGFDLERRSRRMSAFRHSELSNQNRYSCSGSAFSRLRFWGVEKSITMAICALSKNSDC